jgi:hypothetical protein
MLIALITIGILWLLTVLFDLPYIAFALSGAACALAIVMATSGSLFWIIASIVICAATVVELFLT